MKSSLIVGALAATLVSSLQAEVYVLGASWRERLLAAPEGRIERTKRDSAAPRAYIVLETPENPEAPLNGAILEYRNVRGLGKSYSITSGFTGFKSDVVTDTNGTTLRTFGQIYAPVTGTTIADPMMPFSGSVLGVSGWPKRITFDKTVFQTGASTDLQGPVKVDGSIMSRSIMSGGGSRVEVSSATLETVVEELAARLEGAGYARNAVAPVIVEDLPETVVRAGFVASLLSVDLGPDVFPTPSYRWFKGDTQVGSEAEYLVPGGAEGDGVYFVEVSTSAGTATSSIVTVSTTNKAITIAPNLPATLAVGFEQTKVLEIGVNADAYPQVTGYQWQKGTALAGPFTNIPAGSGGTQPTFTVTGTTGATNGPGFYRVIVSNGTPTTVTSAVTSVTTAP